MDVKINRERNRVMQDWEKEVVDLIEFELRPSGISDNAVLAAMRKVKRHTYLPETLRNRAYDNYPLPIG